MLAGKTIALRALEPKDLAQMQIWRNNADMRCFYREYRELSMYDQEAWYKNICCGNQNYCMFGIVLSLEEKGGTLRNAPAPGQLLGVCGLTNIHWVLRSAELSFYIGFEDLYCDDVYAPDAVAVMLRYAFGALNMHKAWAEIYDFDERKKTLIETMGFHKDGEIRDNAFDNGRYSNAIIYSMLESEYRTTAFQYD